jgi:hypothetical protein
MLVSSIIVKKPEVIQKMKGIFVIRAPILYKISYQNSCDFYKCSINAQIIKN